MARNPKYPAVPPSFQKELDLEASRAPDFLGRIADRILQLDDVCEKYVQIDEKQKQLDIEFLRGSWPDYDKDLETLNWIHRQVRNIDPTVTGNEMVKIFALVRERLAATQSDRGPA